MWVNSKEKTPERQGTQMNVLGDNGIAPDKIAKKLFKVAEHSFADGQR